MCLSQSTNAIIALNNDIVNVKFTLVDKWIDKKLMSQAVGDKLIDSGLKSRGLRMKECADILTYEYINGAFKLTRANLCRDRLCPVCTWRLALKRFGEMRRVLTSVAQAYPEYRYSLVTLTVKNCQPSDLNATVKKMSAAWNRLLQRRTLKPYIAGTGRSTEITYNAKTHELHPHFHLLVAWYDTDESDRLIDYWIKSATDEGFTVNSKAQNAQAIIEKPITCNDNEKYDSALLKSILETFKYNIKGSDLINTPLHIFKTIASQISGLRLVSYSGVIKRYMSLCEADVNNPDGEIENEELKADLNPNIDKIVFKWSFGDNCYKLLDIN